MKLNAADRGSYLKGLLVLIGKDNLVTDEERELVLIAGHKLGYEKQFCITAINEILDNEYISNEPPVFSDKTICRSFIIDAVKLAFIDNDYDSREIDYLKSIAKINKVDFSWVDNIVKNAWKYKTEMNERLSLEIENHL